VRNERKELDLENRRVTTEKSQKMYGIGRPKVKECVGPSLGW